jgi:hypothetical protein
VTPEYDQYGDVISRFVLLIRNMSIYTKITSSSSKSSQETPAATIKGDLEASAHE